MDGDWILTVDLGNTSGSVALVDGGDASELARWTAASDPELERLIAAARAARERASVQNAAIGAVGDEEREAAAARALADLGFAVVRQPDSGLDLRIDHPETCGVDRQYAVRAALEAAPPVPDATRRVLSIDAGTALTVDAGQRAAGDSRGAFLGGAIALGPGSLAHAIAAAGARLPTFGIDPDVPALGRSTPGALRSGVAVGFRGAVRELAHAIAREAFGERARPTVFLTGGAAGFARAALSSFDEVHIDPLLVHCGLALAARG